MNNKALAHHRRRLRAEARFRWYGRAALGFAVTCLLILLISIGVRGIPGFFATQIRLELPMTAALLELEADEQAADLSPARFNPIIRAGLTARFPSLAAENERDMIKLIGGGAGFVLKRAVAEDVSLMENRATLWLPASNLVTVYLKNPQSEELSPAQVEMLDTLKKEHAIRHIFNWSFFTESDSRSPENAGFLGAMVGSFFTMFVCLLASFPIAVMAAVYLEEFSRKSWLCELIEVNVNNLAAVPSIVYGLLGLAVYINFMHLPRSAPLVGGLTLALMAFPVIIIATRTALASIPPSIKQGALALGASPVQVVWHHTLPLSMPGIMTGTILGMARAIGETAPLIMIGMVAFVADIPTGFTSAATAMPVQIYLWASSPEAGFVEKTASGILVLLVILLVMNALAIALRKKFEVRW